MQSNDADPRCNTPQQSETPWAAYRFVGAQLRCRRDQSSKQVASSLQNFGSTALVASAWDRRTQIGGCSIQPCHARALDRDQCSTSAKAINPDATRLTVRQAIDSCGSIRVWGDQDSDWLIPTDPAL